MPPYHEPLTPRSLPMPADKAYNFWYTAENRETVFIFVHGIFSDARGCWLSGKPGRPDAVFWPDLVRLDERLGNPAIFLAGYHTAIDAGDFSVKDCAREIIDALELPAAGSGEKVLDWPRLVFICHSTGGIVIRYLLERYKDRFQKKAVGLCLIASPSLGSVWANVAKLAAEYYGNTLAKELQWGGDAIKDIHSRFRDLVNDRGIPLLSGMEAAENVMIGRKKIPRWLRWVIPPRWKVVNTVSAGQYFGAVKILAGTDHFSIVKPASLSHVSHEFLVSFYTKFIEFLKKNVPLKPDVPKPDGHSIQTGNNAPSGATSLTIPASYCDWLKEQCSYMDVSHLDEKGEPVRIDLPETFVPLYAYAPDMKEQARNAAEAGNLPSAGFSGEQPERKPENIEDLIALHPRLLISGHAGTGKTTLLKHCADAICRGTGPEALRGYLPVLIMLRELKDYLPESGGSAPDMQQILERYFAPKAGVLSFSQIQEFWLAGRALFLLDGLDELRPGQRDGLVNAFAGARNRQDGNKLIISGRPHAWPGAAGNLMGDRRIEVLPLRPEQIADFVRKWFDRIYEKSPSQGREVAGGLLAKIKQLEERVDLPENPVERLMVNPLMLTAICILYKAGQQLPEQRADLYEKFIGHLIHCKPYDLISHHDVHEFLRRLAFFMQETGTKEANHADAIGVLREIVQPEKDEKEQACRQRLHDIFAEIEPKCGLLQLRDGMYRFWHWQFQEFLAADHIRNSATDYEAAMAGYWTRDDFKEVIRLYVSLLSINNRGWVEKIVQSLLDGQTASPSKFFQGVEALVDVRPNIRKNLKNLSAVKERLLHICRSGQNRKMMAEAGELLGWLGDPRDLQEFVEIPGGVYDLEGWNGPVTLSQPFRLGKYPVTNQWYAEFVSAGGYTNKELLEKCWSEEGRVWRKEENILFPRFWHDRTWRCPNAPVVGVSWWEAAAFANWLTMHRNDGWRYRLPTEAGWQAAAAGRKKREYPWGAGIDATRCNYGEGGHEIGKTSAAGIFERGRTPDFAIYDLAGNVWEWCYDRAAEYPPGEMVDPSGPPDGALRVFRGGSWGNPAWGCRAAYRGRLPPGDRNIYLGFRLAAGRSGVEPSKGQDPAGPDRAGGPEARKKKR